MDADLEVVVLQAARVCTRSLGVGAFRDRRPWPTEPRPRGDVLSVFADRSFLARADHDVVVDTLGQIARDMGLTGLQLHATGGVVMNACGVFRARRPATSSIPC